PTYGMPAANMARRYTDSILKELASSDLAFSPDQVYATLNTNPTWFRDNMPEVHQVGLNSIAHTRSLRPTIWSLALKSLYEPALQSNRGAPLNMLGALTRIPLMFSGYMMNVLTNVSGMQGFSNMLAMFVEGREKGPGGIIGRMQ